MALCEVTGTELEEVQLVRVWGVGGGAWEGV